MQELEKKIKMLQEENEYLRAKIKVQKRLIDSLQKQPGDLENGIQKNI